MLVQINSAMKIVVEMLKKQTIPICPLCKIIVSKYLPDRHFL